MNDGLEVKLMKRLINFSKKVHPGGHNFDAYDLQETLKVLIQDYKSLNLLYDQKFKVKKICYSLKDVRNFYAHRTLDSHDGEYKLLFLLMAKHNLDELEKISSDPLTVEIINLIGCEITATKTHYYSMLAKEREVDTDDIRKDEIFAMMMVREMMYGYCQIMDEIYGPTDDSIWELLILSEANLSDDIDVQKIKNGLNNPNLSESIIDEVKKLKTLVSVIYESWHSVDWVLPIIDEIQGQEQLNSDDLVSTIVSNIQKQLYADGIFGDDSFSEVMDETIDEVQARKQLIGLREKILKIEKDIVRERGILRKSLLDLILVYKPRTIEDLKNAISVFWDSIDHRQDKYLQDIVDITKNITD